MAEPMVFHLISSAHIDPVWLWDYREGFNEGIATCRAVLDLMDEDPELTFSRGEAAIYEHIEKTDPETFGRIKAYVKQRRWDVIGGTYIQPDENLPDTEVLVRQYLRGQRYFASRFGKPVQVGWSADCFGHTAGLPSILNAAGLAQFMFTRPLKPECSLPGPVFWWEGPGGSRVLACRPHCDWYCIERDGVIARLDQTLRQAREVGQTNVVVMYGVGNHGGGPTRRQIREIRAWGKEHKDVTLRFSTHTRFFAAMQEEIRDKGAAYVPTFAGEIQACERGVYTSMAKLKWPYRKAQVALSRAEMIDTILAGQNGRPAANLGEAWDSILFNAFHDILPGSSIERAVEGQIASINEAGRIADRVEFAALNELASKIDTRVPKPAHEDMPGAAAFLVFNPRPVAFEGYVEIEGSMDSRPLWKYEYRHDQVPMRLVGADGTSVVFQPIATENHAHLNVPWRKRVLMPITIPPMGWNVVQLGYEEGAPAPEWPKPPVKPAMTTWDGIENGFYRVETWVGARGVRVVHNGREVFGPQGFAAATFDDPWGSWGGPEKEAACWDISNLLETWTVREVRILEKGPWRASLWVRLAGGKSRLDLTLNLYSGRELVEISARVFWDAPRQRLKLIFPSADTAEFEVPAGTAVRTPRGDVPGRRWVRVPGDKGFGFISDALSGFDTKDGCLRASVVRSTHYAFYGKSVGEWPWLPANDCGELKFKFLLTPPSADLPALAEELERPPVVLAVPAKKGPLGRSGSLMELSTGVRCLAFKPAEEEGAGWILRLQETGGERRRPEVVLLGKSVRLDVLEAGAIGTWELKVAGEEVVATRVLATEAKE